MERCREPPWGYQSIHFPGLAPHTPQAGPGEPHSLVSVPSPAHPRQLLSPTEQMCKVRLRRGGGGSEVQANSRQARPQLPRQCWGDPQHSPSEGALGVLGGPQAGAQLLPLEGPRLGEVGQRPVPWRRHDHTLPGQEGQQVLGAGGLGELKRGHSLGGAGKVLRMTCTVTLTS